MTRTPLVGGAQVQFAPEERTHLSRVTRTDADPARPWTETTYTLDFDDGHTVAGLDRDAVTRLADGRETVQPGFTLRLAGRDCAPLLRALVRLGIDRTGLSPAWQEEADAQAAYRQRAADLGCTLPL